MQARLTRTATPLARARPGRLRPGAAAALLTLAFMSAWAQQPLAQADVEALVAALGSGPTTRSFMRTKLPDAGNSLCTGQAAMANALAAGTTPTAPTTTSTTRNLEVVPYAGDTTPGVNLSVQFTSGSDRLTAGDRALLDTVALALKSQQLAQDRFAVAGHTDTSGDARINLELSCARALAVRRHLASKGVAATRLTAYGFGSTRLLAPDQPTSPTNRRVEIRKAPE